MRLKYLQSRRIQDYLDKGVGECYLGRQDIAAIVRGAIKHFENIRYTSHAWCIMPNHVHWVVTSFDIEKCNFTLGKIIHSIKWFSANQANKILSRVGSFWHREYYDHYVRTTEEFERLVMYTLNNPAKAGLCKTWRDWPWMHCSEEIRNRLECADGNGRD